MLFLVLLFLFLFDIDCVFQIFKCVFRKAAAAAEGCYKVDIFLSDPCEDLNATFAYADLIDAGLLKVTHNTINSSNRSSDTPSTTTASRHNFPQSRRNSENDHNSNEVF